jgi:ABC-type arginine/histidine transport system permease subunit
VEEMPGGLSAEIAKHQDMAQASLFCFIFREPPFFLSFFFFSYGLRFVSFGTILQYQEL